MKSRKVIIELTKVPEVLSALRNEMGQLLRQMAADEESRVAERLREVAALFETGASESHIDVIGEDQDD